MIDTSTNVNINLAVDIHTYENAAAMFRFKGTTLEAALREVIERAAIDEYPTYNQLEPNEETLASMQEMEDIISGKVEAKGYTDVDEMFRDILSEEDDD